MKVFEEIFVGDSLREFLYSDDNVLFAILFGSAVRGKIRRASDLDIAIYFGRLLEGVKILNYIHKISERAGMEVHLTILNGASALLRHQVMKYGRPIVIKNRKEYIKFREKTITDYQEYKYVSDMKIYD